MICFEVTRNGKRLATAASPESPGVLSFDMARVTGSQRVPPDSNTFTLWAVDWRSAPNEIRKWCEGDLSVGDELVVRVVESANPDPPTVIEHGPPEPADLIERERLNLEALEGQVRLLRRKLGLV